MLLHKNHQFIHNHVAITLPDNVYLDTCPDPCPMEEGLTIYSEDMCAKAELNFVTAEKDAQTFLKEGVECYESIQYTKSMIMARTDALDGFTMGYITSRYIYDEYVFIVPVKRNTLLHICIEQKKVKPADPEQYKKLVAELLAGIKIA